MKIAQIVSTFLPYRAGIGMAAYYYSTELVRLGHQVTVLTPQYERGRNQEALEGFILKRLRPWIKYGNAAFVPQIYFELKKYDIIHLHYPFYGAAEAVLLFKLFNPKKKLIITYHMDTYGKGWLKWFFKMYNSVIMPLILKKADKIIVTTMDYAQNSIISQLLKKYPEKFIEMPLGVDINVYKPKEKNIELLNKYHFLPSSRIVIFVGALDKAHYFKGIENLIVAFKRVLEESEYKDMNLIIVGGGNLIDEYKKLALDAETYNHIIFTDKIKEKELVDYLNLTDMLILPSTDSSEAFGIVLLEAMACGKAVLASDLPGVRTLIKEGVNGYLLIPKNIVDIEEKLTKMMINTDLLKKYGANGRKLVEEKYSWKKIGQQLNELVNNL